MLQSVWLLLLSSSLESKTLSSGPEDSAIVVRGGDAGECKQFEGRDGPRWGGGPRTPPSVVVTVMCGIEMEGYPCAALPLETGGF